MEEIKAMLTDLAGTQKVEINNLDHTLSFAQAIGQESMYFLAGVTDKSKRNLDEDIKKKCYFYADIDIRANKLHTTGKVITDDELFAEVDKILDALTQWNLASMKYVVFTGNGLHLYYVGTEREFDCRVFADGVQYFYDIINFALAPLGYSCDATCRKTSDGGPCKNVACDPTCKNIARISRLPGSINRRLKTAVDKVTKERVVVRDMGPIECKILSIDPSAPKDVFDSLEQYAEEYRKEMEANTTVKQIEQPKSDLWETINKIDIIPIVCEHMGLKVKNQSKDMVALYDGKRAIGAYVYKPFNVLKRTGTSRLDRETYTVYEFVLFEICGNDSKRAKEWFETRYGIGFDKYEKKYLDANIKIPKKKYFEDEGYYYPDELFDDEFEVIRSGELVMIASPTNSGKSTFAQGIVMRNKERHKCLYINLEFDLERGWEDAWKRSKGMKVKIKGTKLDPYTEEEKKELALHLDKCRNKIDIIDMSQGTSLENIVATIEQYLDKGYSMFVIDTFSSIEKADEYDKQNLIIRKLHDICKVTGATILAIHHFNKEGKKISGSQKLADLANVVITLQMEQAGGAWATIYTLEKDKAFFGKRTKIMMIQKGVYKEIAEANLERGG